MLFHNSIVFSNSIYNLTQPYLAILADTFTGDNPSELTHWDIETILVSILNFLLIPWFSFEALVWFSCFSVWLFTILLHHWCMWDPLRSNFACDLHTLVDLYFSQVCPHYLLLPWFSFRCFLVFFLPYWLLTIFYICTVLHVLILNLMIYYTYYHIYYHVWTFYSDWWLPKIESKRTMNVSGMSTRIELNYIYGIVE